MKSFKKYIVFILGLSGLIFYSGCSASSNSMRYAEKKSKENPATSVRYNSNVKDEGDLPADEQSVDISSLVNDNSYYSGSVLKEKILMEVIKYLNTPYKYGGNSKEGIDCSAFTQTVYNKCLSVPLYRTAKQQYSEGSPVDDLSDLKFGDLVFFDTRSGVKPGHVGIYLGDKLFAHASSSKGVIVSSFDTDYYSSRFMGGRRIENIFGSK